MKLNLAVRSVFYNYFNQKNVCLGFVVAKLQKYVSHLTLV